MSIRAGRMRDLVDILQPVKGQDQSGGETREYVRESLSAWAEIEPLRGREFIEARQVVAEVTHRIVGYYQAFINVTEESRIKDTANDREFDVLAVMPARKQDDITLLTVHRKNP